MTSLPLRPDAIIFDFDGVIADSELLANHVLADMVSALGHPTNVDQALDRYMGKRLPDLIAAIEEDIGKPVSPLFVQDLQALTLDRFSAELREVTGARDFLDSCSELPRCIASSSSRERLALSLDVLGMRDLFRGWVFSADEVARGKPHPDLFLMASSRLGVDPQRCLIIEDSEGGVRAGRAAGMTVIGFCAGGHVRPGHADRLLAAGAHHMANHWEEVSTLLAQRPKLTP